MSELTAEELADWPNCATPDCANKSCLALRSPLCFSCTACKALFHQVMRDHSHNPDGCSGCELAVQVLGDWIAE